MGTQITSRKGVEADALSIRLCRQINTFQKIDLAKHFYFSSVKLRLFRSCTANSLDADCRGILLSHAATPTTSPQLCKPTSPASEHQLRAPQLHRTRRTSSLRSVSRRSTCGTIISSRTRSRCWPRIQKDGRGRVTSGVSLPEAAQAGPADGSSRSCTVTSTRPVSRHFVGWSADCDHG